MSEPTKLEIYAEIAKCVHGIETIFLTTFLFLVVERAIHLWLTWRQTDALVRMKRPPLTAQATLYQDENANA